MNFDKHSDHLERFGYDVVNSMYSNIEVDQILNCIKSVDKTRNNFLKTKDLFAIRQLMIVVPELKDLIFNKSLLELLRFSFHGDYFLTKAIYFDKPASSNWFVAYHQDLSISVNQKEEALNSYVNWTFKRGQYGVQPPVEILENIVTVRIHLDDTDENNGALRVIPKSHLKGVTRVDSFDYSNASEVTCNIGRGGVMLMKPLTLHASSRTINEKQRRVIHLEFSNQELVKPLKWLERLSPN